MSVGTSNSVDSTATTTTTTTTTPGGTATTPGMISSTKYMATSLHHPSLRHPPTVPGSRLAKKGNGGNPKTVPAGGGVTDSNSNNNQPSNLDTSHRLAGIDSPTKSARATSNSSCPTSSNNNPTVRSHPRPDAQLDSDDGEDDLGEDGGGGGQQNDEEDDDGEDSCSLIDACSDGDLEQVRRLLEEGRNVNEMTEEGESLLSLACSSGYLELAQLLLATRANVEDRGLKDTTPLMEAASTGNLAIVQLLLDHVSVNFSSILVHVFSRSNDALQKKIEPVSFSRDRFIIPLFPRPQITIILIQYLLLGCRCKCANHSG